MKTILWNSCCGSMSGWISSPLSCKENDNGPFECSEISEEGNYFSACFRGFADISEWKQDDHCSIIFKPIKKKKAKT